MVKLIIVDKQSYNHNNHYSVHDIYKLVKDQVYKTTAAIIYKAFYISYITDFTEMNLDCYSKSHVTPYMHLLAIHIPKIMKKYNGICQVKVYDYPMT